MAWFCSADLMQIALAAAACWFAMLDPYFYRLVWHYSRIYCRLFQTSFGIVECMFGYALVQVRAWLDAIGLKERNDIV